jgi:uncharacterized protein (UPF0332 family)
MNPRDFLDVADELATGIREADWRSAASRAYYAAFHIARRLLGRCGFGVPDADQAHAYLWLRLCNSGQPDIKRAGEDLQYLRKIRNQADYDIDDPFDQRQAVEVVQQATDIIIVLEAAATTPTVLTRITDAMRTYERDVLRQVTWRP